MMSVPVGLTNEHDVGSHLCDRALRAGYDAFASASS